MTKPSKRAVAAQIGLGVAVLWLSLFLGWQSMRAVDFGYPVFYDLLDMDAHMAKYGPQNRHKKDFALTSRAERERLFHEIVVAIHKHGEGLEALTYHRPDGSPIDRLLRMPEVVHLQDVARLLDILFWFSVVVGAGAAIAGGALLRSRAPIMATWRVLLGAGLAVGVITLAVVAIGAKDVFYYLHTVIFPPDHEWFFYYQDSLMTTLMKAPTLFGPIAAAVVALTLVWFAIIWYGLRRLSTRR